MHIQKQFSIFMVNKPGVLAKMLAELARAKVNIIAMTMMDSAENGVMRLVTTNYERAKEVLAMVNMPFSESEVLCVNLPNEPGAFAEVVEKLARNHINISYAYVTAGAKGGRTTGVLKVADVKKAIKVLQGNMPEHDKPAVKKTGGRARR
ncbi:MAG: hypothetical protein A2Y07_09520 [Planctomycetes bacterium GWF2_50_10]|nr:MAG: hypothetical protein A2Y07_09520 [Planctomycetes bacterium GWF2_50_10]